MTTLEQPKPADEARDSLRRSGSVSSCNDLLARPALGDYVLASKFHDCDPQDPWRVGFVVRIIHTWNRDTRYIIGEANSTWSDFYEYRYCRKITPEQGKAWICQANKT